MYPPVFTLADASASVKAVLGTPLRMYSFGTAPEGVAKPYAVWQSVTITPESHLGSIPNIDANSVQVDVYASTPASARAAAQALRDLYQATETVDALRELPREPDTGLYRYQLDVSFWTDR